MPLSSSAWLLEAGHPHTLRTSRFPVELAKCITDIRTFLVSGGTPERAGWRHWLFVKVHTDTGLYGVGECWGWPRVVQTAIEDLTPLVVGEDPFLIERIWQKLFASTQGHGMTGMTGVVGSGAITGIELALWDLKGKALDTPVWNLLGGKMRDRIRLYGHAFDEERARELVDRGFTAMKLFGWRDAVSRVAEAAQRVRAGDRPDGRCRGWSVADAGGRDLAGPAAGALRPAVLRGSRVGRGHRRPGAGRAGGRPADRDRRGVSQPVRGCVR